MIDLFYQNLIKEIKFTEKKFFRKDLKNQIYVVFGVLDKDNYLLKIVSNNNKDKSEMFLKEKKLSDLFKKSTIEKEFNYQEVVRSKNEKGFFWILRKYYPGRSLSEYKEGASLTGYDVIRGSKFLNYRKIIGKLFEQHLFLERISKSYFLSIFEPEPKKRYKLNLEDYPISRIESYINININKQIDFYNINKELYFQRQSLQTCDLVPGNILLMKNGQVMIYDLEFLCFENCMLDYSLLWLYFWRYKQFQEALTSTVIRTIQEKNDFRAGIIRIIIDAFGFRLNKNLYPTDLKKHIWRDYLLKAGTSYDELIKVK